MSKKKNSKKKHRINVYLRDPQIKMASQIDNYSAFVQIATDNAIDIMAWAILKQYNPKKYHIEHDKKKVIAEFNKKFPKDPLFNKKELWQTNSPNLPDVLL